jgi:RNA polymerase sigma-70 factor (ECF subfamily)
VVTETADLVQRIQAGERAAEAQLYARYARAVGMILRSNLRDPSEVEDFLQETFYLALVKIRQGEVRDPERLPQFLASVARNLTIHHFRKVKRRRTDTDSEGLLLEPSTARSQYERVERRQRAEMVHSVLRELRNRRDKELLYRFYIAEEEKGRICEELGLSSLHFNRVLFRARQRFREIFEAAAG